MINIPQNKDYSDTKLTPSICCVLSREAVCTNFKVFGLNKHMTPHFYMFH